MMKRQRGFVLPPFMATGFAKLVLVLLIVVAITALLTTVHGWWTDFTDGLVERGRDEIRLQVAQDRNKRLVAAQAEITRLNDAVRALERDNAAAITRLDKEKTDEIAKIEARKERFVADVAAGRIRLYDPGRTSGAGCPGGGGSSAPTAVAATGVGDGAGGGELSPALAGFLGGEAARADKVVVKLTTCQGIVTEYLRTCSAR